MPGRLFLIFNHEITGVQEKDALSSLGVDVIEDLPGDLKALWRQVPPALPRIRGYLRPVMEWLGARAEKGDYVLIQGDFGACFIMVNFALEKLSETKGQDETAKAIHDIGRHLEVFSKALTTCRGPEISKTSENLIRRIDRCEGLSLPPAFLPLFNLLREEMAFFRGSEIADCQKH